MAPMVKLTVISKSGEEAFFYKNRLVFLHLLYSLVEKRPYLVSTSSYQLSVKAFYCSHVSDYNVVYKNQMIQNGV